MQILHKYGFKKGKKSIQLIMEQYRKSKFFTTSTKLLTLSKHCPTLPNPPHFYTRKRLMHNTVEEEASSKTPFSTSYLKKHYRLHKKALFEQITACTLTGSSPAQPSALARHLPAFRKSLHLLHRQTILMTLTLPINQLMKQDCFFLTKQCTDTKPLEGCLFLPAAGPPK